MDFNPYTPRSADIQQRVAELSERANKIAVELQWYGSVDLSAIHAELLSWKAKAQELEIETATLKSESIVIESELTETASLVGSLLNPANWFTENQAVLRRRRKELVDNRDKKELAKQSTTNSLSSAREKVEQLFSIVLRHDAFDSSVKAHALQDVRQNIAAAKQELEEISARKLRVDQKLAPSLAELKKYESEKTSAESTLRRAIGLKKRLDDASDSKERAIAHQDCEAMFGTSSPNYVIGQ